MKGPVLLLVCFLGAVPAFSQESPLVGKKFELGGSGAFSFSEGTSTLALSPRLGLLVGGSIEVEGEMGLVRSSFSGGGMSSSSTVLSLSGNLVYNIPTSKGATFLLVGIGTTRTSTSSSGFGATNASTSRRVLNFGGGIKSFLTETAAVRIEYRRRQVKDLGGSNIILFGISVLR